MIDTLLDNLGISGETEISPEMDSKLDVSTGDTTTDSSLSASESINSASLSQQAALMDNSLVIDDLSITAGGQMNAFPIMGNFDEQVIGNPNFHGVVDEPTSFESSPNEEINTSFGMNKQLSAIPDSGISSIDVDNLINTPTTDNLEIPQEDIEKLHERVEGVERCEHKGEISFGKKKCPSRHGCQGATDCDYSYGSYPR